MPTESSLRYKQALDAVQAARTAQALAREQAQAVFKAEFDRRMKESKPPKGLKGEEKEAWLHTKRDEVAKALMSEPVTMAALEADKQAEIEIERLKLAAFGLGLLVTVKPGDTFKLVRTASSYTFGSQGWGAANYARESLKPLEAALTKAGIQQRVDAVKNELTTGMQDHMDYQLWAKCEPYEATALDTQLSLVERLRSHGPTANVRVLYPMLCMDHEKTEALLREAGRQV